MVFKSKMGKLPEGYEVCKVCSGTCYTEDELNYCGECDGYGYLLFGKSPMADIEEEW